MPEWYVLFIISWACIILAFVAMLVAVVIDLWLEDSIEDLLDEQQRRKLSEQSDASNATKS